jgi:hypothetical protein
METYEAVGVVVSLFAVRFVAPLLITLAIGYVMNRVSRRWTDEAEAAVQIR